MKLFLIDGHALVFKMYYAFLGRPMINSKGADTSILFGFTKYLIELIAREKPTHLAVSFDPPGGTFRNQLYPEYKANRGETPQLVIEALEPLTAIVKAMGIPVLMMKGYEADDVIGSAAGRFALEGFDVYMVTPDKDYGQLVRDHVFQYRPGKGGDENEILGPAEVCDKWKISSPRQVVDILAICGDSSDNVPGVQGVGPVGAAKLLARYGSVEQIYAHIEELTPRQRAMFEAASDHIALSKTLVTIKTDIPLDVTAADMALGDIATPSLLSLFDFYEFGSLRRKLFPASAAFSASADAPYIFPEAGRLCPKEGIPPSFLPSEGSCLPASGAEACGAAGLPAAIAGPENRGNGPSMAQAAPAAAGIGDPENRGNGPSMAQAAPAAASGAVVVNLRGEKMCVWDGREMKIGRAEEFGAVLQDENVTKGGYELKKVMNELHRVGIELKGRLLDVQLMHYLLDPERKHTLEAISYECFGEQVESASEQVTGSLFDDVPDDEDNAAFEAETELIGRLVVCVGSRLRSEKTLSDLYDKVEEPLVGVLSRMECAGVKVDTAALSEYARTLRRNMQEQESRVREIAGEPALNVSSPKQVGTVIFEKLALDPKAKKPRSGNWPTDEQTLSELSDRSPIIGAILEYRGLRKLLGTYIEPFPSYIREDGRVHTTFNQALTATGRLSSSDPNLQNIPIRTEQGRQIRKAFVPGVPGSVIMSADYSQIELRIMAHLCADEHLLEAFRSGEDVHAATASKIFGVPLSEVTPDQRRVAKTANFGIMYGISAFGLSQRLGCSRTEAAQIIKDYFESFPCIRSFIDDTLASAREKGYVETILGRRRYVGDVGSGNANLRAIAERNAVNAPIQGSSADIIKLAMIGVDRSLREKSMLSRIVLQIHDELVLEVPESEIEAARGILVCEMENVVKLSVPLTVECNYGNTLLEAH